MPAGTLRQALTSDADDVELKRWPATRVECSPFGLLTVGT